MNYYHFKKLLARSWIKISEKTDREDPGNRPGSQYGGRAAARRSSNVVVARDARFARMTSDKPRMLRINTSRLIIYNNNMIIIFWYPLKPFCARPVHAVRVTVIRHSPPPPPQLITSWWARVAFTRVRSGQQLRGDYTYGVHDDRDRDDDELLHRCVRGRPAVRWMTTTTTTAERRFRTQ